MSSVPNNKLNALKCEHTLYLQQLFGNISSLVETADYDKQVDLFLGRKICCNQINTVCLYRKIDLKQNSNFPSY